MRPPHSPLPREITDLILDELALDLSTERLPTLLACATSHSSFVETCQKHIFREVTLLSPPAAPEERATGVFVKTLSFCATICTCPRLASYVQHLTYHLDSRDTRLEFIDHHLKSKTVLDAMGRLPNLVGLVVKSDSPRFHWIPTVGHETTQALVSILWKVQLQSLALIQIRCDMRIVRDLPRAKSLSLFGVAFVDVVNNVQ